MGTFQKKKQVQAGSDSSNINISTVSECSAYMNAQHACLYITQYMHAQAHNNSNIDQHPHKGPGPISTKV